MTASHLFHATHLCHQHAGLRHQETPRFDLQFYRMAQMGSNFVARRTPQSVIVIGIDRLFPFTVRNGQPAACGDRLQILPEVEHLAHHRTAHLLKVTIIHA